MSARRLIADHLAFPSFDAGETYRFYTEVMGFRLKFAFSGKSDAWGGRRYLMTAYDFGGGEIHFFDLDGARRPRPDGLPSDIRHVALSVGGANEVAGWRKRLDEHGVAYWSERHGRDVSVYFTDPNGITLEVTSHRRVRLRPARTRDGVETLRTWTAARKQRVPEA